MIQVKAGSFATASTLNCSEFFLRPGYKFSSARIEDHVIESSGHQFIPIMNSVSLVKYVDNGGQPKSGISAIWSSNAVLRQVLSLQGPLGPLGPLGRSFGVLGSDASHPSYWVDQYFKAMQSHPVTNYWLSYYGLAGPLHSPFSPLKEFGALNGNWREGVYNVLGTAGFLGPLALGPVGPIGALQTMGLKGPDQSGVYHDGRTGKRVDSVQLKVNGKQREYSIFRIIPYEAAKKDSNEWKLGTSFLLDADLKPSLHSETFQITNQVSQLVSFLVIPDSARSSSGAADSGRLNFNLTVKDESGRILLSSNEKELVNFVQIKVPAGAKLQVEVSRQKIETGRGTAGRASFRLMVVGDPYFDLKAEGVFDVPQALPMPSADVQ